MLAIASTQASRRRKPVATCLSGCGSGVDQEDQAQNAEQRIQGRAQQGAMDISGHSRSFDFSVASYLGS